MHEEKDSLAFASRFLVRNQRPVRAYCNTETVHAPRPRYTNSGFTRGAHLRPFSPSSLPSPFRGGRSDPSSTPPSLPLSRGSWLIDGEGNVVALCVSLFFFFSSFFYLLLLLLFFTLPAAVCLFSSFPLVFSRKYSRTIHTYVYIKGIIYIYK